MNIALFEKMLRQNHPGKGNAGGSYSLRFLFKRGNMKPRRLEIGLGTRDKDEAIIAARAALRAIYALGGGFSGMWSVLDIDDEPVSIPDAIPDKPKKKKTPNKNHE